MINVILPFVVYQDFVNSVFLLFQVSDIPISVKLPRISVSPVNIIQFEAWQWWNLCF
jgi:hypothetical protein